jgi:hypothetical protein
MNAIITEKYALNRCHETAVGFTIRSTPNNLRSPNASADPSFFFSSFFPLVDQSKPKKQGAGWGRANLDLVLSKPSVPWRSG